MPSKPGVICNVQYMQNIDQMHKAKKVTTILGRKMECTNKYSQVRMKVKHKKLISWTDTKIDILSSLISSSYISQMTLSSVTDKDKS